MFVPARHQEAAWTRRRSTRWCSFRRESWQRRPEIAAVFKGIGLKDHFLQIDVGQTMSGGWPTLKNIEKHELGLWTSQYSRNHVPVTTNQILTIYPPIRPSLSSCPALPISPHLKTRRSPSPPASCVGTCHARTYPPSLEETPAKPAAKLVPMHI